MTLRLTSPATRFDHSQALISAATALVLTVAPTSALSMADLVIDGENTLITDISCASDKPLAKLSVAIENIGDTPARRGAGGAARAFVSAYAEMAPFTRERQSEWSIIKPRERLVMEMTLGADVKRKERIGAWIDEDRPAHGSPGGGTREGRRAIQRALGLAGFDAGPIDGMFGRLTRSAIRDFQASLGDPETGELNEDQLNDLRQQTGQADAPSSYLGGDREFRIIVVADPLDLVPEEDETNNIWVSDYLPLDCQR